MRRVCRASSAVFALAVFAAAACSPEAETLPAPVTSSPVPIGTHAPVASYVCESGQSATVAYPVTATALLTYKGRSYTLRIVQSASGARYVGSGLEWWSTDRGVPRTLPSVASDPMRMSARPCWSGAVVRPRCLLRPARLPDPNLHRAACCHPWLPVAAHS